MMWRHGMLLTLCLVLCAVVAFFVSAGQDTSPSAWSYADLRLLDAADADQPTQDLLAIYTRSTTDTFQIRLDMLELAPTPDYDLYLALDSQAGGIRSLPINAQAGLDWDVLLVIPASGEMRALDSQMQPIPRAGLRVIRDPILDQMMISLNLTSGYGQNPDVQAFLTPADEDQLSDRSDSTLAGDPPPPPAQVLLAFWNTYPAYTPATALRRWNGAHTGPLGGSHGLLHLLHAARAEEAPLALLDLKYPASLSALDFIGGLGLIQQMRQEGSLILPENQPDLGQVEGAMAQWLAKLSGNFQQVESEFGLAPSPMRFAQADYLPASTNDVLVFADLTGDTARPGPLVTTKMQRWRGGRLLSIQRHAGQEAQAQSDGPSLDVRRALSQAALAAAQPGGKAGVLVLGGSLPESAWGAPAAAGATLHYIKSRPWIRTLDAQDLLAMEATNDPGLSAERLSAAPRPATVDSQAMLEALTYAPNNALGEAAWQAAQALSAPVYPAPEQLPTLRSNYAGQVWSLLEAANWTEHPRQIANCKGDPDRDGQPECILASGQLYAQLEMENGGLTFFFHRDPDGVAHQVIGPTSQLISGLSDPQSWQLDGGISADPAVIPGAFAEPEMEYQPVLSNNELTFIATDGNSRKTYTLLPEGLRLTYQAEKVKRLQIPLLLDPWRRFFPGWAADYGYDQLPSGWVAWLKGLDANRLSVEVRSNAILSMQSFSEALPLMRRAENPNQDYPPGYYLPFPTAEVGLNTAPGEDTIVEIIIQR